MLTESYAVNRNLPDRLYSRVETIRPQPYSHPTPNESSHPNISRGPNTNECRETWDDVLAFLTQNSNGIKTTKQAACSHQLVVAQQSFETVDQQVVRE